MEDKKLAILVVGIGGYGTGFVDELLHHGELYNGYFAAAIAPHPDHCYFYPELVEKQIPIYHTLEEYFADLEAKGEKPADLAVLSTPIHFHKSGIIDCLEHGMQVLCEKPACSTVDELKEIIDVRDRVGLPVSIGYQWSHSEAILALKQDILDGKLGKPLTMRTIVLWPRDKAYYGRSSGWSGKKRIGDTWVLDSVASNATAHYLHNMFFCAGESIDRSADIKEFTVETYRANAIETYDTCVLRGTTVNGTKLLFVVSHAIAANENHGPEFEYVFEKGVVKFFRENEDTEHLTAYFDDGTVKEYGVPSGGVRRKFMMACDIAEGKGQVVCGPEAAGIHTKCVNAITELIPETPVFPADITVDDTEGNRVYVKGLADVLHKCYDEWKLPSELGTGWGEPKSIDMTGYNHFGLADEQ